MEYRDVVSSGGREGAEGRVRTFEPPPKTVLRSVVSNVDRTRRKESSNGI